MGSEFVTVNPNPRLVWFMDYAIDEAAARLRNRDEFKDWLAWSDSWKAGVRVPVSCVDVAQLCYARKGDMVWRALGQLAWAAKEACYSTRESGWLVIRYIADAMITFGVVFPGEDPPVVALEAPPDQMVMVAKK